MPPRRRGRGFKGTRITAYDVLEYLAGGMTEAQIVTDFPALTPRHLRAALHSPQPANAASRPALPREAPSRRESQPQARVVRLSDAFPGTASAYHVGLHGQPDTAMQPSGDW